MLKILFKVIIAILIFVGLGYYSNYLMTGKTPSIDINKLTTPDINISKFTDTFSKKIETIKQDISPKETSLYKWKDAKGVIHYTSEKPSGDIQDLESIKLSSDTNIIPSVSAPAPINDSSERSSSHQQTQTTTEAPSNIYSPEGIKNLINEAKDVQNLMNEQFNQQENLINQD